MISPQPEDPNTSAIELERYIRKLDRHIVFSKRHIEGEAIQLPFTAFGPETTLIPPANTPWTADDKSRFFAALSRHSRHRPDLIGQNVYKSEAEVLWYLEYLEKGAEKVRRSDGKKDGRRDRRNRWERSHRWIEGLAPSAREVDEDDIEDEEGLAEKVRLEVERREGEYRELEMIRRGTEGKRLKRKGNDKTLFLERSNGWKRDDWGENLDESKLEALQALLDIEEAQLCKTEPSHTPALELSIGGIPIETPQPSISSTQERAGRPKKGMKYDKIATDLAEIDRLGRIPIKQRTKEEQVLFNKIKRKRVRDKKRLKKLLAEGMTEAEVREQGGVDIIMATRAGKNLSTGVSSASPVIVSAPIKKEPNIELLQTIKSLNLDTYIRQKGWDIFSFNTLRQPPYIGSVSFNLLEELRSELVGYLRPLLLQVIRLGETEAGQYDVWPGEVGSEHVWRVMDLRGEKVCLNWFEGSEEVDDGPGEGDENEEGHEVEDGEGEREGEGKGDEEGDGEGKNGESDADATPIPLDENAPTTETDDVNQNSSIPPHPPVVVHTVPDPPWQEMTLTKVRPTRPATSSEKQEHDELEDDDEDEAAQEGDEIELSDLEPTLSENEDLELDQVLDEMDTAYDDLVARGSGGVDEDWDDPWFSTIPRKLRPRTPTIAAAARNRMSIFHLYIL